MSSALDQLCPRSRREGLTNEESIVDDVVADVEQLHATENDGTSEVSCVVVDVVVVIYSQPTSVQDLRNERRAHLVRIPSQTHSRPREVQRRACWGQE